MFEIRELTPAQMQSVTNRAEHHGDDKVPAVTLGIVMEVPNTILDTIKPGLRQRIYGVAGNGRQDSVPGIEVPTPKLLVPGVESMKLDTQCHGWTFNVDHGIKEEEPIKLGGSSIDGFVVSPKDGGTVRLSFRVGSSDVDALSMGLLGFKVGQQIHVTATPPDAAQELAAKKQADTDKAMRDQKALEKKGQQRLDADAQAGAKADAATKEVLKRHEAGEMKEPPPAKGGKAAAKKAPAKKARTEQG